MHQHVHAFAVTDRKHVSIPTDSKSRCNQLQQHQCIADEMQKIKRTVGIYCTAIFIYCTLQANMRVCVCVCARTLFNLKFKVVISDCMLRMFTIAIKSLYNDAATALIGLLQFVLYFLLFCERRYSNSFNTFVFNYSNRNSSHAKISVVEIQIQTKSNFTITNHYHSHKFELYLLSLNAVHCTKFSHTLEHSITFKCCTLIKIVCLHKQFSRHCRLLLLLLHHPFEFDGLGTQFECLYFLFLLFGFFSEVLISTTKKQMLHELYGEPEQMENAAIELGRIICQAQAKVK